MTSTEDLKTVVAANITKLRRIAGITQAELAEKLNYTDKAISKWERGESLPDIVTLKQVADLFGVTVDYLISESHEEKTAEPKNKSRRRIRNRGLITGMSILLVWLIATFAFVNIDILIETEKYHWLAFVYAVPVSMIVWLVLNSVWFDQKRNYLIVSFLMWTVLASMYLTALALGKNIWLIFIIGIPAQAIIFLWSFLKIKKENRRC